MIFYHIGKLCGKNVKLTNLSCITTVYSPSGECNAKKDSKVRMQFCSIITTIFVSVYQFYLPLGEYTVATLLTLTKTQMKNIVFLFLFVFISFKTFAQLNESDTVLFQTRLNLTGANQTGNVAVFLLKSKIDFSVAPSKNIVFKSQNSSLYQEFYNKQADNDIFSRNYLYFFPQKRIYPFAMTYIATNYRRKIDFRYFVGAGATLQVLRKQNHVIKFALSTIYEYSRFSNNLYNQENYNGNNEIKTWRATAYLFGKHTILAKKMTFFYDTYVQPSYEKSDNFRWQTDIGIDCMIWKGLSFNVLYAFSHENIVSKNVKEDDSLLTFGLSYSAKIN